MKHLSPFIRLMRLDRPIGTLLLLWPTLWALWLANRGMPPLNLLVIFSIGTLIMRSAGCVINDIADRDFDGHVERTQHRPLATGEVSLKQAITTFIVLLLGAFSLLFLLKIQPFTVAVMAALVASIYPFCKRFLAIPQLVLGIAFSMGIPLAFICSNQPITKAVLLLMLINFMWIIAYDTYYALVDREDDLKVGLNSAAIHWGENSLLVIGLLQFMIAMLWLEVDKNFQLNPFFYFGWAVSQCAFIYQMLLVQDQSRQHYFEAFLNNNWYGLLMLATLMVSI